MPPTEQIFVVLGILLFTSVLASKASSRFGVPALLLFLIVGMFAGDDGLGHIHFDDAVMAKLIGDLALTIILFSGGLDSEWQKIRPVLLPGLSLASVGVAITVLLVGSFSWYILGSFSSFQLGPKGISWGEAFLLGSIIASTDAAAVFSVLRSSSFKLSEKLQGILELESGSNDPLAVLLTLNTLRVLTNAQFSPGELIKELVIELVIGVLLGYGAGRGMVWLVNHIQLSASGLYPVLTLGLIFFLSGMTTFCHGSPILAVYLAGMVMGQQNFVYRHTITSFHDGLTWLVQIIMCLTFGLLAVPGELPESAAVATAIALFLIFIARPVSVFTALSFSQFAWREKIFIAWVGLRGAIPMILATIPLTLNIPQAKEIFNVVVFIVLISILLQGLTLIPMAKWLNLGDSPGPTT
ncbi:MAG: potassium/proton antiporter [Snowella sp.]|nr:potassium/proton antiporter [Snowella sp.]